MATGTKINSQFSEGLNLNGIGKFNVLKSPGDWNFRMPPPVPVLPDVHPGLPNPTRGGGGRRCGKDGCASARWCESERRSDEYEDEQLAHGPLQHFARAPLRQALLLT